MEYGKFLISDILEKVPFNKLGLRAKTLPKEPDVKNVIPLIAAGVDDQGTVGFVDRKRPTVLRDMITVSANGTNSGATFYQKREFSILQDAYPLRAVAKYADRFNDNVYLYMTAILKNRLRDNDYNNKATWNRIKFYQIELPVMSDGTPDFAYMARRIDELEAQRIDELSAYLKVSGLDNTVLTDEEKDALTKKVAWKKFRVGDLFHHAELGDTNLKKADLTDIGDIVITSGKTNCGILGRTTRHAKLLFKNTLTIDMFGFVYYRDFPYKMVTHGRVMSLASDIIKNREIGLYLAGSLSYLSNIFSYDNMATWKKVQSQKILLPVKLDGTIDFNYMQHYITAIEKQSIKGVIAYKDKLIATTKKIVSE